MQEWQDSNPLSTLWTRLLGFEDPCATITLHSFLFNSHFLGELNPLLKPWKGLVVTVWLRKLVCSRRWNRTTGVRLMRPNWIPILPACYSRDTWTRIRDLLVQVIMLNIYSILIWNSFNFSFCTWKFIIFTSFFNSCIWNIIFLSNISQCQFSNLLF